MNNPEYYEQSLEETQNIISNNSLFRDTPHYWVKVSLPLAYAMACIEVVLKNSEQARIIYQKILKAWIEPEFLDLSQKLNSEIPESEHERIKKALKHPETEFYPNSEKPFQQLEGTSFNECPKT